MTVQAYIRSVQPRNDEWQVTAMAFTRHPDVQGKIFVPDRPPGAPRKHACRDCFFCQFCSDDRCQSCLAPPVSEQGGGSCSHHRPVPKQKDSSE